MTDHGEPTQAQKIAARFEQMTPADKLRVAAGLLEKGDYDPARIIIKRIGDELTLLKLFPQPTTERPDR